MSGDLTWAKADFKGKFTVFISTNNATARTLTISNTGFVAGDFICLLINQNSSGSVNVTIGTRSIASNRGNIINALFDGTNWNVWSGGGVFNTTNVFNKTIFGLGSNGVGTNSTGFGSGVSTANNSCSFGSSSNSESGSSTFGTSSSATGNDACSFGRSANGSGSQSSNFGFVANANSFARSNNIGAYSIARRYGSTRLHLGTTTNTTDATNPSQNKEWATWNGTTANNTITEIFLRGVSSNRCVLQAKNVIKFRGQCTAFRSDYSGSAGWDITGLIKRDGSNVTTLVGVTATLTHSDGTGGTLVLTIDADDTNESLRVQVTGNASETWTWLVELELLDLRIA
jgi:hypothetical protein